MCAHLGERPVVCQQLRVSAFADELLSVAYLTVQLSEVELACAQAQAPCPTKIVLSTQTEHEGCIEPVIPHSLARLNLPAKT